MKLCYLEIAVYNRDKSSFGSDFDEYVTTELIKYNINEANLKINEEKVSFEHFREILLKRHLVWGIFVYSLLLKLLAKHTSIEWRRMLQSGQGDHIGSVERQEMFWPMWNTFCSADNSQNKDKDKDRTDNTGLIEKQLSLTLLWDKPDVAREHIFNWERRTEWTVDDFLYIKRIIRANFSRWTRTLSCVMRSWIIDTSSCSCSSSTAWNWTNLW